MKNFRALMGMMLATAAVVNVGAMADSAPEGNSPMPFIGDASYGRGRSRIGDGYGRQSTYDGRAFTSHHDPDRVVAAAERRAFRNAKRAENGAKREAGIVAARVALGCAS
jgi:hypothetical protein